MNCLSWNCRGAGKGGFTRTIKYISRHYSMDLLALMETKTSGSYANEVCQKLKVRLPNSVRVEAQGFKRGLWLLWDGNVVDTQVLTQSHHFIRVAAKKGNMHVEYICTYGPPTVHRRRRFWLDLRNDINLVSGPLFIIGDFNCILSSTERIEGSGGLHPDSAEFQSFIDDLALVDMGFSGQNTTWSRGDSTLFFVAKRLDRALVNIEACLKCPSATVRHLPKFASDHTPLLLNLDPSTSQNRHRRPFTFEGAWLLHPDFRAFLFGAWNGENEVVEALSRLKPKLVRWNKMIFRNIDEKKKELLEKLDNMQRQLSRAPSQTLILADASIQKDFDRVLQEEKARDRNTAFFHTSTLICHKRSMILTLKADDETWIEDLEVLERHTTTYHMPVEELFPITSSHGLFPVLTKDRWRGLEIPFSDEEFHKAACSMGAYKAPGLDGFQPCFFQRSWDIVGTTVLASVKQFFLTLTMSQELNHTLIALIAKVSTPESISQFRSISLCNVVFKLITKTLVLRMQLLMNDLVSPMQGSIISGRLITTTLCWPKRSFTP
ncbi:hypothetical protein V2J09_023112 [Rumex salicifolius]